MILQKLVPALILGILTQVSLTAFPYYPAVWVLSFTLVLVGLGYLNLRLGFLLFLGSFLLALAYHSTALFILIAAAGLVFRIFVGCYAQNAAFTLLIFSAPVLAALPVSGLPALEFAVVFLAPFVLKGKQITKAVTLACLWCCLLGVIAQTPLMGNLVIGPRVYEFFKIKAVPETFYHLNWILPRLNLGMLRQCLAIVQRVFVYLFAHPVLLTQVFAWGIAGHVLAVTFEKRVAANKVAVGALGIFGAAGILILVQFLNATVVFPQSGFAYPVYLISLAVCAAAAFFYREWAVKSESQVLFTKIKPSNAFVQNLMKRERERKNALSLDESLQLQKELQKYIKKKFVQEVTALDLDVAGSAQLKLGESPERVTEAFTEFWKFVDLIMLSSGARLLNRAGDGAIYIFGDANKAVVAAKDFLRRLDEEFNQKKNPLKHPFKVRQGLNTGTMIEDPSQNSGDVFSEVLDISGHLQKAAEPGEIVISNATYQKLVYKDDFESRGNSAKDNIPIYAAKILP